MSDGRRRGEARWLPILLLAVAARPATADVTASVPALRTPDFGREIRPLLARRCFTCHGPDAAARQAGLRLDERGGAIAPRRHGAAIVPGDDAASVLLQRLVATDPDVRMPPPETGPALTPDEIDRLRRWIDAGAPYPEHWAWIPPERPEPPPVVRADWPRNPIDRFVLARLESEGLPPAPEADRPTLIRRVTLDLTGLPPTPADVDAFVADRRPDAYERVVDRLLASPHYGEHWARPWLDAARYADTKGYEADRRRTMWPYRDWVVQALSDDLPFDRFTVEQLAGDLLPAPTTAQLVATGFHRNTMTNDEGGTDDEEFRVAAVVDRVNTTMQTWMGLGAGCAQCHDHKYDPLTQAAYYRLFDFFNHTEDSDRMDEHPRLALPSDEQQTALDEVARTRADLQRRIEATLATIDLETAAPLPAATHAETPAPRDLVWIDDDVPPGARSDAPGGVAAWTWVEPASPPPHRGTRTVRIQAEGTATRQVFFTGAARPLDLGDGDVLFAHVYVDPTDPPRELMLQWHTTGGDWEHRAAWGADLVGFGVEGTASRRRRGDLPLPGTWVRLEVPAAEVGLPADAVVDGWAFTQAGGTALWDHAGVRTRAPEVPAYLHDRRAWETRVRAGRATAPEAVRAIVTRDEADRDAAERLTIETYYVRHVYAPARPALAPLDAALATLDEREQTLRAGIPTVLVMRERSADGRRTTHVLAKGSFLSPGAPVTADVPAFLPPLPADAPRNRLGLARWLVARENPLTARVQVNRVWQQLFGPGLVETAEDFGTQGTLPSHPALLDWLAMDFMERGWSVKSLCRTIVTSATYRQSSAATPARRRHDPYNRLLARGPRGRLPAEVIRDQALALGGLLDPTIGGPPVFPPQPDGVWQVIYSNDRWTESAGSNRHRRALYTFWRRTSPYPSLVAFDTPSRELCVSRRVRTNTPLQALVTLNDPAFVEAARGLARRTLDEGGPTDDERLQYAFRRCVARAPDAAELATLLDLLETELAQYRAAPEAAARLVASPAAPPDAPPADHEDERDVVTLAAWTVVGNVLLNLDEVLVKP